MRAILLALLLAAPADAVCWTTNNPVRLCAAAPTGPVVRYEWRDVETGAVFPTTGREITMNSASAWQPLVVQVRGIDAQGQPGPWSLPSAEIYANPRWGMDFDANGTVSTPDITIWRAIRVKSCKSCAPVNGISACPSVCEP